MPSSEQPALHSCHHQAPRALPGSRHGHISSLHTSQLHSCVFAPASTRAECEDVRSHVGSHAARHMLWVECRVSACLLTGVCKLHEGKERECAVCSAWGIPGSVACVPCLCVRGTRSRPSTQSTARVSCSQTERLHRTFEPPAENSRLSSQKPTPVVSAPRVPTHQQDRAKPARGAFCGCPRAVFLVFGGKWRAVLRTSYGSQQASEGHVILRDTCSHLKRGFWGEVVPKARGRYNH